MSDLPIQDLTPAEEPSVAELIEWLNGQFGVNLISDNNGKWALSWTGMQQRPPEGGFTDVTVTVTYISPQFWQPSIREAIAFYRKANA